MPPKLRRKLLPKTSPALQIFLADTSGTTLQVSVPRYKMLPRLSRSLRSIGCALEAYAYRFPGHPLLYSKNNSLRLALRRVRFSSCQSIRSIRCISLSPNSEVCTSQHAGLRVDEVNYRCSWPTAQQLRPPLPIALKRARHPGGGREPTHTAGQVQQEPRIPCNIQNARAARARPCRHGRSARQVIDARRCPRVQEHHLLAASAQQQMRAVDRDAVVAAPVHRVSAAAQRDRVRPALSYLLNPVRAQPPPVGSF